MNETDEASNRKLTQERLLISKLSREDLEDKYLNIYDENFILKKHVRKQEDRIKKMATKLIRLVNDKKKSTSSLVSKQGLDVETQEYVDELEAKVGDLETLNKRLKENLQTHRMQLQALQAQKNSVGNIYSNVTSRIDTGIPKRDQSLSKNLRTISGNISSRSLLSPQSNNLNINNNNNNYNKQIQELETENQELKNQIDDYESHVDNLNQKIRTQKAKYEEAMQSLKSQVSQDHILGVQENIEQIRLQRELKEKSNEFSELYTKFNNLSQNHAQLKENHNQLLDEVERLNQQLKHEHQHNVSLKTEINNLAKNNHQIFELKGRIEDLEKENETLKEENQKFLTNAFSVEREREFRERERALKVQIAQLEATLKSDVSEKGSILDRLTNEREQYDKLNNEMKEIQIKYYDMKQKYDDMNEKMKFLSQESQVDFNEIEEALMIIKDRKLNRANTDQDFINKVDAEKIKVLQRKLVDLEAHLAETIGELDKSRHLLITQVKINDDYKKEVLLIQNKMEENKAEFDAKIFEYAQLLDLRAARIKKLERQLNDIAYGTKQVKVGARDISDNRQARRTSVSFVGEPAPNMLDHHLIANLERGQNIFEIHITRLNLSEEALRILKESDPSTFCTIEFFEHELQTTPIVKGSRPEYNFTSQYVVKVDDFFLHYLQKETTTIELHQAIGSDYNTKAACQLSFRDLIDQQVPRLHGVASLTCITNDNMGVSFGSIEYWARLIVPVDEAFRLYKERTKALGYLSTNIKAARQHEEAQPAGKKMKSSDNMNELKINVLRCAKLNIDDKSSQPSPYCVYKFYDFNDHDTEIIKASNNPEFNDHKSFVVPMDMDLDRYLKKECLEIYVFDDNEPETNGTYLGMASIPLIGLAHDKDIKGTFELKREDGKQNGTLDVTLYWQYTYLPPSDSTFSSSGSKQPISQLKKQKLLDQAEQRSLTAEEKAKMMGLKLAKDSGKLNNDQFVQPNDQKSKKDFNRKDSSNHSSPRHANLSDNEDSIGNATIHGGKLPANLNELKRTLGKKPQPDERLIMSSSPQIPATGSINNNHYNDTMFGDEQTELDSLRSNYQNNLANNMRSDDENDHDVSRHKFYDNEKIEEEEINDEDIEDSDNHDDDDLGGIQSQNMKEYLYANNNSTGRSDDGVVVGQRGSWDPNDTSKFPKNGNEDFVIIEICNFMFNEKSTVLKRDDVKKLFVGMSFLNYDPGDLESKNTMPKPKANEPVYFNFRKMFEIDAENNSDKREQLAKMIYDNDAFLSFAVVAEPDSDEEDCEDIGYSYIGIQDLINDYANYYDKELDLHDANDQNVVIGKMAVTVEIIDAINAIKRELAEGKLTETL